MRDRRMLLIGFLAGLCIAPAVVLIGMAWQSLEHPAAPAVYHGVIVDCPLPSEARPFRRIMLAGDGS